jgi:hypothetical protein
VFVVVYGQIDLVRISSCKVKIVRIPDGESPATCL